jgi:holo-[acyl-carrier protein] synthase
MKVTCGTDIIEIKRIQDSIEKLGDRFLKRIFTEKEIEYCESKKNQKYQHYAARFAAKEAAFKALSCKINDKYNIKWTDFEVTKNEQGRPIINIYCIDYDDIENIDISLSHCKEYAIANVTVLIR